MTDATAFRDPAAFCALRDAIRRRTAAIGRPLRLIEFCGGHTHAILRYGIRDALAPDVELLSGPGCPVCVTSDADIDAAIALARLPGVILATFGDMVRVPGTHASLQEARATGADVRIVYSALDAVALARRHPAREVVLLGIGFETTAPTVAAALEIARTEGLANFSVFSLHKRTPPALRAILETGAVHWDGVLGPGHVAAVTGWRAWEFLPTAYGLPCAIAGFEPLDILHAIAELVAAAADGRPRVVNAYRRGVTAAGNRVAQALLARAFASVPTDWRGLGEVAASGLALRPAYATYDARRRFALPTGTAARASAEDGCRCGAVLRGAIVPPECPHFGHPCTPAHPLGPCMVSSEGACAAYYRYGSTMPR
ncbi:MAG TPA: hydrogenase formation protein HypD [Chloroflexi bacterium]|jgi:hydrogenase expression/formation protein HypD|nr:hydrogenase formation protein HypD [Chloroflexota bacterium]